jgi:outer membrane protein assembly factor BamB
MNRFFLTLTATLSFIGLNAQDVAQWRGPNRDGIYNETGLLKKWPEDGPKLLWHFDDLGEGHTSAAVTSEGVFISGMKEGTGIIYAFDLKGNLKWKKEYGPEWTENHYGVRSTPLVIKDKLYFMSSFGNLLCLSTGNGQTIWSIDTFREYGGRNITWGVTENLLYDGNTLFCTPGGSNVAMIAVDRNTGKLLWKSSGKDELTAYCSPLLINLSGRKLIVTWMENSIEGFDAASGKMLWSYDFTIQPFVHPNIPVFIDGLLYCTSGYGLGGVMLKLSPDGTRVSEVWKNNSLDPKMGGVVVLNGRIYGGGDMHRKLFCLDWLTGKELYSISQLAPANIIADDGLLYVYSESGNVSLIEPQADKFNIISSFNVPLGSGTHWAHLVINNKKLYVRHQSSLMVYDIAAGSK